MAKPPPTVAATSTLAMIRAAAARGVSVGDVLASVGLSLEYIEDPDSRLPSPAVVAIWNALRERTNDPALQLVAPTALPFGAYRIIDYLVASSPTVGGGIRQFARFFALIADGVALTIDSNREEHRLDLQMADGSDVPPVYVDYVFAALVSRIRMRIRPALRVKRVEMRQPRPAAAARYEEVFQAPVEFGATADRLVFSDDEWKSRTDSGDEALARLLEEHARILSDRLPTSGNGFRADVQRALAATVYAGGSIVDVARALHVSVRTLQRKLVEAGTTFRKLSDAVKDQLAQEYLSDPRASIPEVAFLLGFSDQSSFNRAFRRWTGQSPGEWRRRRVVAR